jgi:hypothetical protein
MRKKAKGATRSKIPTFTRGGGPDLEFAMDSKGYDGAALATRSRRGNFTPAGCNFGTRHVPVGHLWGGGCKVGTRHVPEWNTRVGRNVGRRDTRVNPGETM